MASILVNGISAKYAGGKSILVNFLTQLHKSNPTQQYIVVVPRDVEYLSFSTNNITILPLKNSNFALFTFYFFTIKQILRRYDVSLILNFADVIVPVSTNQIYLFDWPYAIYPDSIVWSRMSKKDWLFRKLKLFLIKSYIHTPVLVLAQTATAKDRLKQFFRVDNVEVVPNAVSLDNLTGGKYKLFALPKERMKLLYLTKYYSHKNFEIIVPLARIIRDRNLPYCIVITIDGSQHANAKKILETLKNEMLDEIVTNVGYVQMDHVPSLYQQVDALLMPSLLESFSGTYVEAMYHGKPVFTSDLDFARAVCGDTAFYFNPLSAESIIDSIEKARENPDLLLSRIELSKERLADFLSWQQVFDRLSGIISKYQVKV